LSQTLGNDTDPTGRGRAGRTDPQVGRLPSNRLGVLDPGADAQGPVGGHQLVPRDPIRIGAPGSLPVPTEALDDPESLFDPDP
jgi:hypothetical protein